MGQLQRDQYRRTQLIYAEAGGPGLPRPSAFGFGPLPSHPDTHAERILVVNRKLLPVRHLEVLAEHPPQRFRGARVRPPVEPPDHSPNPPALRENRVQKKHSPTRPEHTDALAHYAREHAVGQMMRHRHADYRIRAATRDRHPRSVGLQGEPVRHFGAKALELRPLDIQANIPATRLSRYQKVARTSRRCSASPTSTT